MDLLLLAAASFIISRALDRGVLCDGSTVLCSGGEPTPAQWLAEMSYRSTVAYTSYAVVALVLITSVVIAWRHGHKAVVAMQCVALTGVALLAVLWEPYIGLH